MDLRGRRRTDAPVTGTAALPRSGALVPGAPLCRAEGEGFEPPRDGTAPSDFRDRRISAAAILWRRAAAAIGTPLEHIAGALWTSTNFHGLGDSARPPSFAGKSQNTGLDALNS